MGQANTDCGIVQNNFPAYGFIIKMENKILGHFDSVSSQMEAFMN